MLNSLLWTPLLAGLIGLALPKRWVGTWSVAAAATTLGLAIGLLLDGSYGSDALNYVVDESWIPDLGVRYSLGVDGLSIGLVVLTAAIWLATVTWSALHPPRGGDDAPASARNPALYFAMLGIGETATLGAFLAQDLLLFVAFFDLMLIPFYFLVGIWGQGERRAATIKMIIYTLVGSLLMLVGAIATAVMAADGGTVSFAIADLREHLLGESSQKWIFALFALAFLVKMPAVLVHGWMPDAYRSCPLPVLALLSGVLSKVAAYGFLRWAFSLFPDAAIDFQLVIMLIALGSIIYGSAMAFTQTNVRLIAGFSSVAQMGFITLGIFSMRIDGIDGAVLQMINHGIVAAAAFFVIAALYARFGTEDLTEMGGMASKAPFFAVAFMIITLATLAMPGSANFIGEFYILSGAFQSKLAIAVIASGGVALAAFYALRMYQRSIHNRLPEGATSRELDLREAAVIVPLVLLIIGCGLVPNKILARTEAGSSASVSALVSQCREHGAAPTECAAEYGLLGPTNREGGFEPSESDGGAGNPTE